MSLGAYLVGPASDSLTPLSPSAPPDEDRLQALIERHPELVGRGDARLLLVSREQGVADKPEAGWRWSLDHLFVTPESMPVLVEVKRAADTRLRREVIGQLLDYAANGAVHWTEAMLAQSFARTCEARDADPGVVLMDFLADEDAAEGFWRRVEANLRDGRVRLLIVADSIPPELARVVEFLNEPMQAEVLAVELRHFRAKDGQLLLIPRIVGETEQTKVQKGGAVAPEPVSVEEWLDREIGPSGTAAREGADAWLAVWGRYADRFRLSGKQESLAVEIDRLRGGTGRPAQIWRDGTCSLDFHRAREEKRNVFGGEEGRSAFLRRYEEAFPVIERGKLHGWSKFRLEVLTDPARRADFEVLVSEWVAAWREGVA